MGYVGAEQEQIMYRKMGLAGILSVFGSISGCSTDNKQFGGSEGEPELEMSDFFYDDLACEDSVPFEFTIANFGDADAEDVTVQVGVPREAKFSDNLGTIGEGDEVGVSGSFSAVDDCFTADAYTVTISLAPSNGDEASFTAAIAI
jgi:hypothetical protein